MRIGGGSIGMCALAAALAMSACGGEGGEGPPVGGGQPGGAGGGSGAMGGGPAGAGGGSGAMGGRPAGAGSGGMSGGASSGEPAGDQGSDAWSPAARVTALSIPPSPDQAHDCPVTGAARGTGLAAISNLYGGGLDQLVRPDAEGEITLVLLAHADGFPGAAIDLGLFLGDRVDGRFFIDPRAFVDGDPARGPQLLFAGATVGADGRLAGGPTRFDYTAPIGENIFTMRFEQTVVRGRIRAEGEGFAVEDGVLAGYLTDEAVEQLVVDLRALCAADEPPAACGAIGGILRRDDAADTLVGLVGGYDARLEGGVATDCQDDCNALSVCARFTMSPVTIAGVADTP